MRTLAAGLLALVCAQGCASHRAMDVRRAGAASGQRTMAVTVESHDRALSSALLKVRLSPTPANHRAAADEYRRLGILDTAFDHLTAATRIDPRDAAAYDARARIWRDWGYAHVGMGDAARAVYHAPGSAAAHNTWGTLLAAAGRRDEARREFERALSLDPDAAFARINLCRLDGSTSQGPRKECN